MEKENLEKILKIKQLQEERVKTYQLFEEKFQDYLDTKFEKVYQHHCQLITKKFIEISSNINAIEKEFEKDEEISSLIRTLQSFEKENLKMVIEIQLLRKDFKFNKGNDLMDENEIKFQRDLKEKKLKHTILVENINETISFLLE
jgi:hypothetical protein